MANIKNIVCDLGGVLIKLNVPRCIEAFEALMGKDNLRNVLGMDEEGVSLYFSIIWSMQNLSASGFTRTPVMS